MSAARIRRIGYVGASADSNSSLVQAFREGLQEYGYVEGATVDVVYRLAALKPYRYPKLVDELLGLDVELIVTADSEATPVARRASDSIPIVMSVSGDPVGEGLVASLDRPGGNVTGLTNLGSALSRERLELVRAVLPEARRVAVLWNLTHPGVQLAWEETSAAAAALMLELVSLPVQAADDLAPALQAAASTHADALIVLTDRLTTFNRRLIVAEALEAGLPGVYG